MVASPPRPREEAFAHELTTQLDVHDIATLLHVSSSTAVLPRFEWGPCSYRLHSASGGAWTEASSHGGMLQLGWFRVQMAQAPEQSERGFVWHKNCVLPNVHVTFENVPDPSALEGAAVLMSAVVVDPLTLSAHSVGLNGVCLRPLVNRACSFASLSFKTTSYNLPGKPLLHLMATLLVRARDGEEAEQGGVEPFGGAAATGGSEEEVARRRLRVARALISPGLVVDARKRQAKPEETPPRVEASAADGGTPRAILPFAPEMLECRMEKVGKEVARRPIDNSIEGLRAYMSALNIRNKCKHPLFLVLRFDDCVALLYDRRIEHNPADDDAAFYRMLATLGSSVALAGSTGGNGAGGGRGMMGSSAFATGSVGDPSPFVVAIKPGHDADGSELTARPVMRLSASVALPYASSLPSDYAMLDDAQVSALRHTYCRLYSSHWRASQARHASQVRHAFYGAHAQASFFGNADGRPPAAVPPAATPPSIPTPSASALSAMPMPPGPLSASALSAMPMPPRPVAPSSMPPRADAASRDQHLPAPLSWLSQPMPAPAACDSCAMPLQQPAASLTSARDVDGTAAHRYASALLSSAHQLACGGVDGVEHCPEAEWLYGLRILSEALTRHCRTRSAAEIMAFMQREETTVDKRPAVARPSASDGRDAGRRSTALAGGRGVLGMAFDHCHSEPTTHCPEHVHCYDAWTADSGHPFTQVHDHNWTSAR